VGLQQAGRQAESASDKVRIVRAARACKEALSAQDSVVLQAELGDGVLAVTVSRSQFDAVTHGLTAAHHRRRAQGAA
jgi:molecular chaperone HscA